MNCLVDQLCKPKLDNLGLIIPWKHAETTPAYYVLLTNCLWKPYYIAKRLDWY